MMALYFPSEISKYCKKCKKKCWNFCANSPFWTIKKVTPNSALLSLTILYLKQTNTVNMNTLGHTERDY